MSRMQTPEEFAADMHASMLSCDREDLIRERDAEVRADERAKVLAGFTEERKDRRSCGCRVPVNAVWSCCFSAGHTVATERRLVSAWEPAP